MKIDGKEAIVLTRDRRFVRIPATPGLAVGQETEVGLILSRPRVRRVGAVFGRPAIWAAAIAAVLMLWAGWRVLWPALPVPGAYAYVTVEVDGVVELAIDSDQVVVDSRPLGPSAGGPDPQNLVGLPVQEAVTRWVEQAVDQHRLRDGGEVLIASSAGSGSDRAAVDGLNKTLAYAVADAVKRDVDMIHVNALQVPEEIRRKAVAEGMSPGRYYLYVVARDRGLPVSLEEFRRQSVSALLNSHRELIGLIQQIEPESGNRVF